MIDPLVGMREVIARCAKDEDARQELTHALLNWTPTQICMGMTSGELQELQDAADLIRNG